MQYRFEERSAMDLRSLRFLVLWPHRLRMEDCVLEADFFPQARHFAAVDVLGEIVACCTLIQEVRRIDGQDYPVRLRAMASHPAVRGTGVGKRLLEYALKQSIEKGFWCDAREKAVPFYLSCGWQVKSEPYEIPIIGTHFLMIRQ